MYCHADGGKFVLRLVYCRADGGKVVLRLVYCRADGGKAVLRLFFGDWMVVIYRQFITSTVCLNCFLVIQHSSRFFYYLHFHASIFLPYLFYLKMLLFGTFPIFLRSIGF